MRTNPFKMFLLSLAVFAYLSACTYNKEDKLYPTTTCDTAAVNYNNNIKQILQSDCLSCHGAANFQSKGGGKNLDGYNNAMSSSARILSRVIDTEDPMPPPPKERLSACKVNQIRAWINQGMKDN